MALHITDKCINCGACELECPNHAIYEGGMKWTVAKGTQVKGEYTLPDGKVVDAGQKNAALSFDFFYIVPGKCTECRGFYDKPQCVEVCQADACVPLAQYAETTEQLLAKKGRLHGIA
jgi:ferredoxin